MCAVRHFSVRALTSPLLGELGGGGGMPFKIQVRWPNGRESRAGHKNPCIWGEGGGLRGSIVVALRKTCAFLS
jgi:hypothetical protein